MSRAWARTALGRTIAVAASLTAVRYTARADTNPPSTRPSHVAPAFKPGFAAMDYYDTSCAKCHGPYGSFYGPTLGNDLTDAALIKKCHAMEVGLGNSPLADDENVVVVAYHRSLILRMPYVSVTDASTPQWTGEVTPGATVTLEADQHPIPAAVTDFTWTATLPPNIAPADVIVTAALKAMTTTLKLGDSAFSSTAPLPPPGERYKR